MVVSRFYIHTKQISPYRPLSIRTFVDEIHKKYEKVFKSLFIHEPYQCGMLFKVSISRMNENSTKNMIQTVRTVHIGK